MSHSSTRSIDGCRCEVCSLTDNCSDSENARRIIRFENEMATAKWLSMQGLPIDDGSPARLSFYRWLAVTGRCSESLPS
jgi:hypothetical protein